MITDQHAKMMALEIATEVSRILSDLPKDFKLSKLSQESYPSLGVDSITLKFDLSGRHAITILYDRPKGVKTNEDPANSDSAL